MAVVKVPMRLGVNLRPLVPAKIGGMESYARNILEQLVRRDRSEIESICVFTSPGNHELLQVDDPRVRKVLIQDDGAARQILLELVRDQADALFCPLVELEPRDAIIPSFVTIPDMQHEVYPHFFDARTLSVLREVYPASTSMASKVFTISEFSRQALITACELDPAKVIVVPLDVDSAFREKYDVEEREEVRRRHAVPDRYVLFPAITWPHKNHGVLLRAVRMFNARHVPVGLVLTGSAGPAHEAVMRAVGEGLSKVTLFLDHIPRKELACLYQDSVALVFPSLFEGFGLPILEAFHSSCPVICSATTSCPEIAGDAALYVDPSDPAAIAAALVRLEESRDLRESLIARGHERASKFSWDEAGRRTYETIRAVVDESRQRIAVSARWPSMTVVTPSFNQGRFIAETIDSVLGQDYPDLEFIVVDGGSTDGTVEILRHYGNRLRWISELDQGQADAVNKGVALGRGEIIGWLNSDDTYLPGALGKVGRAFAARDDLAVVYGDADHVLEDGTIYAPYPTAPFSYQHLAASCFICQPAAFVRRKSFDEIGGLDPTLRFCMDYDLWIRLGRRHRFAYLPERLARSRLHAEAKTFASRRKVFEEIIRTVRRHYGFVPFDWAYGYADYLFNRSNREVFTAKHPSAVAFCASLVFEMWLNRGRPSYWTERLKLAGKRVLAKVPLRPGRFEGRWGDGWISRRYVAEVLIPPTATRIEIRGRHQMPGRGPLMLSVFVNGVSAGAHVFYDRRPFRIEARIPDSGERTAGLEIVADRAFRPLYRGSKDGRLLSCIIDEVKAV